MNIPRWIMKPISIIPSGVYCYDEKGLCPYWRRVDEAPRQENGYCMYLEEGDLDSVHLSLLWDQCKECGVNCDFDFEDYSLL